MCMNVFYVFVSVRLGYVVVIEDAHTIAPVNTPKASSPIEKAGKYGVWI